MFTFPAGSPVMTPAPSLLVFVFVVVAATPPMAVIGSFSLLSFLSSLPPAPVPLPLPPPLSLLLMLSWDDVASLALPSPMDIGAGEWPDPFSEPSIDCREGSPREP